MYYVGSLRMQIKFALVFLVAFCAVAIARAGQCDCTQVPIRPEECVKTCGGFILQHTSRDQLKDTLGLSSKTAEAIAKARIDGDKNTPPDLGFFRKTLSRSEYSEASTALKDLNQQQLDVLLKDDDIRREARKVPNKGPRTDNLQ
jgi:hypothetical protein